MSKLSISRRPAIVAFVLATAAFATGCVTEVDDTTPSESAAIDQRYTGPERRQDDADLPMAIENDTRLEAASDDVREGLSDHELTEAAAELAIDVASGQLTDREAFLVTVIAMLDDGREDAWADPVLQAVRPQPYPLPEIDAEEADFVDPITPLLQGGN